MSKAITPSFGVFGVAAIIMAGAATIGAWADEAGDRLPRHNHIQMAGMMPAGDMHDHHQHMMRDEVKRSMAHYELPDISLLRDDGKSVSLQAELDDGRPVVMNFIFTTCSAICPVTTRTFSMFQEGLGSERNKVHMVSISIDPEQDTPSALRKYASKYGAGPEWHFYSGTEAASIAAQKAFDVYRGDKMNHTPVTLLRAAPGQPWLRIDGLASAADLLSDYRTLVSLK